MGSTQARAPTLSYSPPESSNLHSVKKLPIVFVCIENSCRSQLAEAFGHLNKGERFEVYSAGSKPSGRVNPKAIATMQAREYDLDSHHSKSLDDLPELEFAAAITMGCGDECGSISARLREDWGIPDPKHMDADDFAEIRDGIEGRVKELFERLESA